MYPFYLTDEDFSDRLLELPLRASLAGGREKQLSRFLQSSGELNMDV
jgi:hypothetical protein